MKMAPTVTALSLYALLVIAFWVTVAVVAVHFILKIW